MAKKRRARKSGYVTPFLTVSKKNLMSEDLFVNRFYDDWEDYRDGFRDWYKDFKQIKKIHPRIGSEERVNIRISMNKKQKILTKRRKKRLEKKMHRCFLEAAEFYNELQNISWLRHKIEDLFGEKCPDFCKECYCCQAWSIYDDIVSFFLEDIFD